MKGICKFVKHVQKFCMHTGCNQKFPITVYAQTKLSLLMKDLGLWIHGKVTNF